MGVANVLHMNGGDGKSSYASNSAVQKNVILNSRKFVEDTVKDYATKGFPECFKLVDLGCSSGPNTLTVVTNIIDIVHATCHSKNLKTPEIQVFLNDLPDNDFNTIFRMVPQFYSKLENEMVDRSVKCFVSAVPGSFYTRLFPTRSIHFVHSSYSIHWLSQVPEKLENNKGNIYISKAGPPGVYEAYFNQYIKDFSKFLRLRSEEVIPNGRMTLTFVGRSIGDPTSSDCCSLWELLANSLHDISAEGLIQQEQIDLFNIPLYTPCANEVKAIVETEGSFSIDRLETHEVDWDMREDSEEESDKNSSGEHVANSIRAVMEPLLANQFGTSCMDKLFERYALHVDDHLSREKTKCFNIAISLTRKMTYSDRGCIM